ncbi:MAG: AMP-binding protein, partial [Caulobacterales bacterium]
MVRFPDFEPRFPRRQWTVPAILEAQARERPTAPFLQWTDEGEPLSFGEVNTLANRIAHGFSKLGIAKHDKVAIFLPNCLEYPLIWFALNKLGAVEVTICNDFKGQFLRHPLKLSGARMIVTAPELAERIAEMEDDLPDLTHVIVLAGDQPPDLPRFKRLKPLRYDALLADAASNPAVEVGPRDAGAILFTSGTTGPSKAVLMPH